ncbi:cytochrome P450 [Streptomyces cylindrosporus]|uniref:Cytochrome P450 n=1 Tax=Streptomyces cylindrosporus TaxID=2927583 RepID=A0ABS9Y8V0_9ACTN|nr:cytochrome P450 [Streptomyces cylindrosporus]MCI3273657.1 cytochrome P450 [Streptomyces cylindrosporus]
MSDVLPEAEAPEWPMPRAAGCPFDPPPALRALTDDKPLARVRIWDGSTPWIVTGHAAQRTLLGDPRVSVDERLPGFPHWHEGMAAAVEYRPRSVFNSDAPEHTRYRRIMTGPFTLKRVEALRPTIQKITDDLIDRMLAGPKPADLVEALALPLPTLMISELLGVPYEDHDFFQENAARGIAHNVSAEESMRTFGALNGYLVQLVEKKAAEPADDALSDIAARVNAGDITVAEAAMMGLGLLIAGHETSANMIGLATAALLEHPEQLALLRDTDDPKVVAGAVEELLRYLGIIHGGQRRIAKEDIEIAGETIRAGEGIIIELFSANRDADVFPEPDVMDLRRANARHHNAFGFGIHQCVGQQLARVELQIVYCTLFRRVPTLALAVERDEIQFKHDRLAYGVYTLPVTW